MTNNHLAFVFPGQGSQSVGMLKELAEQQPIVEETFNKASDVLGYDLWELVKNGPEEELNNTEKTQPVLLAAGVALWRIWGTKNKQRPAFMAGHSLGEYTALVCAKSLEFEPAVKLVADRGRFMQEAVPSNEGGMAAIVGLDEKTVAEITKKAAQGQIVTPANYNSLGQVVIAGHIDAVNRTIELAKKAGAKIAKMLPVSIPSHCELMKSAAVKLTEALSRIPLRSPEIPVIHNVDVAPHSNIEEIRVALIKQLDHPVRWVETIQLFEKKGIKLIIECGPGKVLTGLNKRISSGIQTFSISTPEQLKEALHGVEKL